MLIQKSGAIKSTSSSVQDKTSTVQDKTTKEEEEKKKPGSFRTVDVVVVERPRSSPEEAREAGRLRELRRVRALQAHAVAEQDMKTLQALSALQDWRDRLHWRAERSVAERDAKASATQRNVERLQRAEEQRLKAADDRLDRQEELLRRAVAAALLAESGGGAGGGGGDAADVQLHRVL